MGSPGRVLAGVNHDPAEKLFKKPMNDQPLIRFGVVGYGLFGFHHARAIEASETSRLVAVTARSEASRQRAVEDHPGVAVHGDYREMLERDDLEVVSVVAPNMLHYEMGMAVLESGKHLLLEKPMALTVPECDQLVELAEREQRILAVGHELRLSSLWGRVKQLIEEGAIGRVQHVLVELSRFPYRPGSGGWRYDQKRVGSWILEEPIHFFDLARWYLEESGDPVSIYARANSRDPSRPQLADNFSAIVNYPDHAYALVSQSLAAFGHYQTAKVVGTGGAIWAEWGAADARSDDSHFALRYGLGDDVTEVELAEDAGELVELAREIDAMAESVRSGKPPPCTGVDGRWSTLLCLAAEKSVRTGQLVVLEE